jgi:hypothetical protein
MVLRIGKHRLRLTEKEVETLAEDCAKFLKHRIAMQQ